MFYNQYHTYVNLRKTCLVSIQYVGDVVLCRHIIPGIIPPIIECMTIFAVDIVSVHVNSYTNVTNVIYYSLRHYNINRYIDDWRTTIVHVGIFHMQSYYSYTTNIPWWSYTSNFINACIGLCILIKNVVWIQIVQWSKINNVDGTTETIISGCVPSEHVSINNHCCP
jgi:hypothetical protein